MRGRAALRHLCLLVACCLAWGPGLQALTDESVFRDLRFNFMNAGPRAMGLGGAFVAVGGDVSSADANPAALYGISGPRFFVEFRHVDLDTRKTSGESGSLAVDPVTGERDLPFFGVTSVSEPDAVSEPSFFTVAWPLRLGSRGTQLTLIGSRQTVLSEDRELSSGNASTEAIFSFDSFPNTVGPGGVEAYSVAAPVTGDSSMEIVYYSVGASLAVHQDFSFGYTISYASLDLEADTATQVNDPLELFLDPAHPRLPTTPTSDVFRTTVDDDDDDVAYSIGVHWHPDSVFASGSSPWSFGAVFRKGAEFDVSQQITLNGIPEQTFSNTIIVPDRYSLGATYASGSWRIVAEVEEVEYSDLLDGFQEGVNFLTSQRLADLAFGVDPDAEIRYDVDDGTVPRIGAEYTFELGQGSGGELAVRGGYFRSPDSRIRMKSFNSDDDAINDVYIDAFDGDDDENHFTAGVGYTRGRSVFGIAGDFADDGFQVVGSYTYRMSGPK